MNKLFIAKPAVQSKSTGFTLVELSIVLVIIGLLIGGILVARSMVETSKTQMQIRQLQQFDIAVQNFWTNFKMIPGDCPTSRCGTGADNGDGDGYLEDHTHNNSSWFPLHWFEGEAYDFFNDLSQMGMIKGSYIADTTGYLTVNGRLYAGIGKTVPLNAKGNGPLLVTQNGAGQFWWALTASKNPIAPDCNWTPMLLYGGDTCNAPTGLNGPYSPAEALAIDRKVDDGLPSNGNVIANFGWSSGSAANYYPMYLEYNTAGNNNCTGTSSGLANPPVANSTDKYNVSSTTVRCGIIVLSSFEKN